MKQSLRYQFSTTTASVFLDALRGAAALVVCLEHSRNLLFVDFGQLANAKALCLIPYLMSGAGHQAVIIFFVLSGYLISKSVLHAVEEGRWNWSRYAVHRTVRLWIVLIPALLLGAMWDGLGLTLGFAPGLYRGLVTNHMMLQVNVALRPSVFVGNLFFLQTVTTSTFGSNGALWSLANEFWYYFLFPLALFSVRRHSSGVVRILCAVAFGLIGWFVGKSILSMFPIWLLGVLLNYCPTARLSSRQRLLATAIYVPVFFGIAKAPLQDRLIGDYVLGLVTVFYIWSLLSAASKTRLSAPERWARAIAGFSYTLYLLHTPLLVFLAGLTVHDSRWQPQPRHILAGLGILAITFLYAWLVAMGTEFKTGQVRRWIGRRIGFVDTPIQVVSKDEVVS